MIHISLPLHPNGTLLGSTIFSCDDCMIYVCMYVCMCCTQRFFNVVVLLPPYSTSYNKVADISFARVLLLLCCDTILLLANPFVYAPQHNFTFMRQIFSLFCTILPKNCARTESPTIIVRSAALPAATHAVVRIAAPSHFLLITATAVSMSSGNPACTANPTTERALASSSTTVSDSSSVLRST